MALVVTLSCEVVSMTEGCLPIRPRCFAGTKKSVPVISLSYMEKHRKSTRSTSNAASASVAVSTAMAETLFFENNETRTFLIILEGSTIKALMTKPEGG